MIPVTRLNGEEFYINARLIEFIEQTPDTVITMTTGKKVIVSEPLQTVLNRILDFEKKIVAGRI